METLEQIYQNCLSRDDYSTLSPKIRGHISLIADYCDKRKGVYTVLTTLLYYKYLHPEQDIRLFQTGFKGGFSARSFDTKFVTPTLKKLGLPAMAESGWLTRSMEQPYPYDFHYKGKIYEKLKMPFLEVLDFIEKNPKTALDYLLYLLKKVQKIAEQNKVEIIPLKDPDKLSIDRIMSALKAHFLTKYDTHNQLKEAQYKGVILSDNKAGDTNTKAVVKDLSNIYYYDTADVDNELSKHFRETYQKRFGEEPSEFAKTGYDSAMRVVKAIELKGKDNIREGLAELKEMDTTSGHLKFLPNGGVEFPLVIKQMQSDGTAKIVKE